MKLAMGSHINDKNPPQKKTWCCQRTSQKSAQYPEAFWEWKLKLQRDMYPHWSEWLKWRMNMLLGEEIEGIVTLISMIINCLNYLDYSLQVVMKTELIYVSFPIVFIDILNGIIMIRIITALFTSIVT